MRLRMVLITLCRTVKATLPTFQGRVDLMKRIHSKLIECSKSDHSLHRIAAVVGFAGMGKSELVRKFVDVYKAEYPNVAWIDSTTEQGLRQAFRTVAQALRLPEDKRETTADLTKRVFLHVGRHANSSLFVYDNASSLKSPSDGGEIGIFEYLPLDSVSNVPLILITSRTTEWSREGIPVFRIGELSIEESVQYFLSVLGIQEEEPPRNEVLQQLILKLATILHGYPLGLKIATAMLNCMPDTGNTHGMCKKLEAVIEKFKGELDVELMEYPLDEPGSEQQTSLHLIWAETIKKVQQDEFGSDALQILEIMGCCNSKEPFTDLREVYNFLNQDTAEGEESHVFHMGLHPLKKYGFLQTYEDADGKMLIKVHAIVKKLAWWDVLINYPEKNFCKYHHLILCFAIESKTHCLLLIQSLLTAILTVVKIRKALLEDTPLTSSLIMDCSLQDKLSKWLIEHHKTFEKNGNSWRFLQQ